MTFHHDHDVRLSNLEDILRKLTEKSEVFILLLPFFCFVLLAECTCVGVNAWRQRRALGILFLLCLFLLRQGLSLSLLSLLFTTPRLLTCTATLSFLHEYWDFELRSLCLHIRNPLPNPEVFVLAFVIEAAPPQSSCGCACLEVGWEWVWPTVPACGGGTQGLTLARQEPLHAIVHVEVRGQLIRVVSHLSFCVSWHWSQMIKYGTSAFSHWAFSLSPN